jgi:chromosomal replication initiation ATPase DnaA
MSTGSVARDRALVKALALKLGELRKLRVYGLVKELCSRRGATVEQILSERRSAHVCRARHIVWWELIDRGWTYVQLGALFERDHSTISRGVALAAQELGLVSGAGTDRRAA